MPRPVIDASITLEWLLEDSKPESRKQAWAALDQVVEHGAWVPPLWHYEIANVAMIAARRKNVASNRVEAFRSRLNDLPIETDDMPLPAVIDSIRDLAAAQRLTVYDAAYLELARRLAAPLATLDAAMAAAAQALRIPLLQLD